VIDAVAAASAVAAAVEVVVSILPSGDATADVYKDNQSHQSLSILSSKYSVCSLSISTGKIKESMWKHFVDATETRKQTLFLNLCICFLQFLPRDARSASAVLLSYVIRPSVCLYRGLIGWTSSKLITRIISLGSSLLGATTSAIWSKGNTPKIRVE